MARCPACAGMETGLRGVPGALLCAEHPWHPAMFCGGACRALFLFLCQQLSHSMWHQTLCPAGLWGILSCPSSLLSWTSADMC